MILFSAGPFVSDFFFFRSWFYWFPSSSCYFFIQTSSDYIVSGGKNNSDVQGFRGSLGNIYSRIGFTMTHEPSNGRFADVPKTEVDGSEPKLEQSEA